MADLVPPSVGMCARPPAVDRVSERDHFWSVRPRPPRRFCVVDEMDGSLSVRREQRACLFGQCSAVLAENGRL